MTRFFALLSAIVLLVSCGGRNSYVIEGEYLSAPDGTVLYMSSYDNILSVVDSAVVDDGKFEFSGSTEEPGVYFISSSQVVDGGFVVVEPGDISFRFGRGTRCSGTENNRLLSKFMYEREKISALNRMGSEALAKAMNLEPSMNDSLEMTIDLASRIFDAYAMKLITENIGNELGCFFLAQSVGYVNPLVLAPMFDSVPECFRGEVYRAKLRAVNDGIEELHARQRYADEAESNALATSVGKKYRNFELNNIKGGKVLFSDVVSSHRYAVLVFWAGWDSVSAEEVAAFSKRYGSYRSKGTEIVGISLDRTAEECEKAVDGAGAQWINLCNPSGGSAEVAAAYGVTSLPAYIVVNKEGTIISRGTSLDDAKSKLEEIL